MDLIALRAPVPRSNFRYFSWVPDHRSPAIAMADLLPFPALFVSPSLAFAFALRLALLPGQSSFVPRRHDPLIPRDAEHAHPGADTDAENRR